MDGRIVFAQNFYRLLVSDHNLSVMVFFSSDFGFCLNSIFSPPTYREGGILNLVWILLALALASV